MTCVCTTGVSIFSSLFFFNDTAPTEIYPLSLHDALPISRRSAPRRTPADGGRCRSRTGTSRARSEEHTSELQSRLHLVFRLLLEKKKKKDNSARRTSPHETNLSHPPETAP